MEHEKKKKHKKKKNKQGKTSVPAGAGESTSDNSNHANVANQNHQNLNSDSSDVPKRGQLQAVGDSDRESISGTEMVSLFIIDQLDIELALEIIRLLRTILFLKIPEIVIHQEIH